MGSNVPLRSFDGPCNGSINHLGHIPFARLRRDIRQFYCECRENGEDFANSRYIYSSYCALSECRRASGGNIHKSCPTHQQHMIGLGCRL